MRPALEEQPGASRSCAAGRRVALGRIGVGRFERNPLAGIAADDVDPGDDRGLVGIAARFYRAAGNDFAALRPEHAKPLEPPPGPAGDENRRREAKAASGDGGADRFAALCPDRVRATEPGVQRRAVVVPAVAPQDDLGADAVLRLRRLSWNA